MKDAYIVVGPEASGNRFMVQLLTAAGCTGHSGHKQPWDSIRANVVFGKVNSLTSVQKIAFHRSLPHGKDWPDLNTIVDDTEKAGYKVTFLVMVREGYANTLSQVASRNAHGFKEARDNYKQAYRSIFQSILEKDTNFVIVPYTSLGRKKFVSWLFEELGLSPDAPELFKDGDLKYHKEAVQPGEPQQDRTQSKAKGSPVSSLFGQLHRK